MTAGATGGSDWRILAPEPLEPVEPGPAPTLSVFIAYYNGADFIRGAVESALAQTHPAHEIVICDDGSPDDLEEALGPVRERVRIVRQENGGVGSAMNTAVRASSGDFVVWLDQDDHFAPRRLEGIAAAAVQRPDLDVIATDALLEVDGEAIARLQEVMPFAAENQRLEILRGAAFFLWPAIRRSSLRAIGDFDESFRVVADYDCFVRLITSGSLVGYVDAPLYRHNVRVGSLFTDAGGHFREIARSISRALETDGFDPVERAVAEGAVAANEQAVLAQTARQAVEQGRPDARRRSLELMRAPGMSLKSRVKAGLSVASPGLARRFLVAGLDREALLRRAVAGDQAARKALIDRVHSERG